MTSRKNLEFGQGKFNLFVQGKVLTLEVKSAYKEDIAALKRAVKTGEVAETEAGVTCFLAPEVFARLFPGRGASAYLSNSVDSIKLGGDPEFVLVNPSTMRFQYAEHLSNLSLQDELGHDGPLAEVRPPPSDSAEGLVHNIRTILARDKHKVDNFLWFSGAAFQSPTHPTDRIVHIGGHIQFGDPANIPPHQKTAIYKNIVRVLDETVGLALVRVDTPLPHHRRNKKWKNYGRYGRWGDYKAKENRFEWRVPSGLWLTHPTIAQAVLGTARAVVLSCYQDMADRGFSDNWICARMDRKGFLRHRGVERADLVQKAINNADPREVPDKMLDTIASKLESMETYEEHKAEIDEFLRLVRLNEDDIWAINLNTRNAWLEDGPLFKETT